MRNETDQGHTKAAGPSQIVAASAKADAFGSRHELHVQHWQLRAVTPELPKVLQ